MASAAGGVTARPVRGVVAIPFGRPDRSGAPARGVTIAAARGEAVVAPAAGRVLYAGAFRSYGQILIIRNGGGYHTVMAGLGWIGPRVGAELTTGERIGDAADVDHPALYYEVRRNDQPIDPSIWLSADGAE